MKSIILLAMSTLNANVFSGKPGDTFAVYGDEKKIENCKSQLEPVVRYFLSDSECANEVEMLMLCTRQTLEIATDFNGNKFKDEYGKDIDNISAVTFLMDRIDKCDEKHGKEITYKAFPLYREGEERILPEIDCNKVLPNVQGIEKSNSPEYAIAYEKAFQPDYISGMREAIQSIRNTVKENMQKDKDFKTPFYIVTHGGPRDVMLSLNAVVSLLDEEGIIPTKICGTNLATKMIDDQRASFDMFRFVSGMRDFLNFGNVDVLQKYYSDSTTFLHGAGVEKKNRRFQHDFLKALDQVSIGVQYSNPDSYREGLIELNKIMTDESDIYFSNSNLGIFKDTIKNDFGAILDNNEINIIDMVERCVNKKQYQQALTFVESAFPDFYRKNNIISFSSNSKENLSKFNDFLGNNINFNLHKKNVNSKKKYVNSPEKIVNRFCSMLQGEMKEDEIIKKHMNLGEEANKKIYCEIKKPDVIIDQKYDFDNDIFPVLKMHKTLKKIRNLFSHGNGKHRPDVNNLSIYIKYYLKALRNLVEKSKVEKF